MSKNYWEEYSNLQHVKHELIRNYLNGWLPKLTLGSYGSSKVLYFDTHAGRGTHKTGQLGSPLVALETILNHTSFPKSEIRFFFIEHDKENHDQLTEELKKYKTLPANVKIFVEHGDCFELLRDLVDSLKKDGMDLAPSFIFCDPFGFNVPFSLLAELMEYKGVELFVNVIWRELDMAIAQGREGGPPGMIKRLNQICDGDDWKGVNAEDHDARAEQCVAILRDKVGAKWATYIRMLQKNNTTRYFLLHLSNHDAGRVHMKECMWKSCPEEGYYARIKDNPKQQYLLKPEPDLSPLEEWLIKRLSKGPVRYQTLFEELKDEIWLDKHLNQVVRKLRKEGALEGTDYDGKFAPTNNPLLSLCN